MKLTIHRSSWNDRGINYDVKSHVQLKHFVDGGNGAANLVGDRMYGTEWESHRDHLELMIPRVKPDGNACVGDNIKTLYAPIAVQCIRLQVVSDFRFYHLPRYSSRHAGSFLMKSGFKIAAAHS